MPALLHELLVAPLVFGLAFVHAARALGRSRAALELLCLALYGFALERAAMRVFDSHDYLGAWRLAPWGVPLAVAAVWAAVILSALTLAARLGWRTPLQRAAGAALIGVALDLLMEPVAVRAGLWRWTPPGPWLGVPLGNFVGWGIVVGAYAWGSERFSTRGPLHHELARRVLLATGAIALLLGVGWLWTQAGCERLFAGGRGAALALGLQGLTLALPLLARRAARRPAPATPGTLLARTPGAGPLLVPALLALTFSLDALRLGRPELLALVLCTWLALGSVLAAAWARARAADPAGPAPERALSGTAS